MPATIEELKAQAQTLTADERAELAYYLLDTLEPDDQTEADEQQEIARRIDEIRKGSVSGRPVDDVLAELRERYQ